MKEIKKIKGKREFDKARFLQKINRLVRGGDQTQHYNCGRDYYCPKVFGLFHIHKDGKPLLPSKLVTRSLIKKIKL